MQIWLSASEQSPVNSHEKKKTSLLELDAEKRIENPTFKRKNQILYQGQQENMNSL